MVHALPAALSTPSLLQCLCKLLSFAVLPAYVKAPPDAETLTSDVLICKIMQWERKGADYYWEPRFLRMLIKYNVAFQISVNSDHAFIWALPPLLQQLSIWWQAGHWHLVANTENPC